MECVWKDSTTQYFIYLFVYSSIKEHLCRSSDSLRNARSMFFGKCFEA